MGRILMELLIFSLIFAVSASSQAHNLANWTEAEKMFDEAAAPQDLTALVGGYSGACVWNSPEGERTGEYRMFFGYFELGARNIFRRDRNFAFFGGNLYGDEGLTSIWEFKDRKLWKGLQRSLSGKSWWYKDLWFGPLNEASAFWENGSYVSSFRQLPFGDDFYREEFRIAEGGVMNRFLKNGSPLRICSWYTKVAGCQDIPEAYRGGCK